MTAKWVIPLSDVPPEMTVHDYIFKVTDLNKKIGKFDNFISEGAVKVKINFNLSPLQNDLKALLKKYPAYSYPYGIAEGNSDLYKMIYLMFNPRSKNPRICNDYPTPVDDYPKEDILGYNYGKNSYNDTLSITNRTKFSNELFLKEFFDSFKATLTRSRIAIHSSLTALDRGTEMTSWHIDENIFINTRVSVPVVCGDNFGLEFLHNNLDGTKVIKTVNLEEGFAYTLNTREPHGFFAKRPSEDSVRLGLICGISPWFNFDDKAQTWYSNDYYGELHPFEIMEQGLITPLLSAKE